MSMRLSDGVILRKWSESECYHHVKESRAFCKARAQGVQLTIPCGRSLIKVREKLVSRHCLEMLTAGVVRMRYLGNMQYLRYKIQSNYECCNKLRDKGIDAVYVGVKLLYKHDGTPRGSLKQRFPTPSSNDFRERSVGKNQQNHLVVQMNATFLEVLREVLLGLLIIELDVRGGKRRG